MARLLLTLIELGLISCIPAVYSLIVNDQEKLSTNNRELTILNNISDKYDKEETISPRESKYNISNEVEGFQSSLKETQDENKILDNWDFAKFFKLVLSFATGVESENISLPTELQEKFNIQKNGPNIHKKLTDQGNGSESKRNTNKTPSEENNVDEEAVENADKATRVGILTKYFQSIQKKSEGIKPFQMTNKNIELVSSNDENDSKEERSSEVDYELKYEFNEESFEKSTGKVEEGRYKSHTEINVERITKPKSEYKSSDKEVPENLKTSTLRNLTDINFDEEISSQNKQKSNSNISKLDQTKKNNNVVNDDNTDSETSNSSMSVVSLGSQRGNPEYTMTQANIENTSNPGKISYKTAQIEKTRKINNNNKDDDSKQPVQYGSVVFEESEHSEHKSQKIKVQIATTFKPQTSRNQVTVYKKSDEKNSEKVQILMIDKTTNESYDYSAQTNGSTLRGTTRLQEENLEYTTPQMNIEKTFTFETVSRQKTDEASSQIVQKDTMNDNDDTLGNDDLKILKQSELDISKNSPDKKQEYPTTQMNIQRVATPEIKNEEAGVKEKSETDESSPEIIADEHPENTTQQMQIQAITTLKPHIFRKPLIINKTSDKKEYKNVQTEMIDITTNESDDSKEKTKSALDMGENSEVENLEFTTPEIPIENTSAPALKAFKQVTNDQMKSDGKSSKIVETDTIYEITHDNNIDDSKQPIKNSLSVSREIQRRKPEFSTSQVNIQSTLTPEYKIFRSQITEHKKPTENSSEIILQAMTSNTKDDNNDNLRKPSKITSNVSERPEENKKYNMNEIIVQSAVTNEPYHYQKKYQSQRKLKEKDFEKIQTVTSNKNEYDSGQKNQTIDTSNVSRENQNENLEHTAQQVNIKSISTPENLVHKLTKTSKTLDEKAFKIGKKELIYSTLGNNNFGSKKRKGYTPIVSEELQDEFPGYRTTKANTQSTSTLAPSTSNNNGDLKQHVKNKSIAPKDLQEKIPKYITSQLNIQNNPNLKSKTMQNKAKDHKPNENQSEIQQLKEMNETINEDKYNAKQSNKISSDMFKEEKLKHPISQENIQISPMITSAMDHNNDNHKYTSKSTLDVYKGFQEKTVHTKQQQPNKNILNEFDELQNEELEHKMLQVNIHISSTFEPQTFQNKIKGNNQYEKSSFIVPNKASYDNKDDLEQPNKSISDVIDKIQKEKQGDTSELRVQSMLAPESFIFENSLKDHMKPDKKSSGIAQTDIVNSITNSNMDLEQPNNVSLVLREKTQEENTEYTEPQLNNQNSSKFKTFKFQTEDQNIIDNDNSKKVPIDVLSIVTDSNYDEMGKLNKNVDSPVLLKEEKQDYLVSKQNIQNLPIFKSHSLENRIRDRKEANKDASEMMPMKIANKAIANHGYNEEIKQLDKSISDSFKKLPDKNWGYIKPLSNFQISSNEHVLNEYPLTDETNFPKLSIDNNIQSPKIIENSNHEISHSASNFEQIIPQKPISNPFEPLSDNQYAAIEDFVNIPVTSKQFKEDKSPTPSHKLSAMENFERERLAGNTERVSQEKSLHLTRPFLRYAPNDGLQNLNKKNFQNNYSPTQVLNPIKNQNISNKEILNKPKYASETVELKVNMKFTTPSILKVPFISSENNLNYSTNKYLSVFDDLKNENIPVSISNSTIPLSQVNDATVNDKKIITYVMEKPLFTNQENEENIIDLYTKSLKEKETINKEIGDESEKKFENQHKSFSESLPIKQIREKSSTKPPLDQNMMHSIKNNAQYFDSSGFKDNYGEEEIKETIGLKRKNQFITTKIPGMKKDKTSVTPLASSFFKKVTSKQNHRPFSVQNTTQISNRHVTFDDQEDASTDQLRYKNSNKLIQVATSKTTNINDISKTVLQTDSIYQSHSKSTNEDHQMLPCCKISSKFHENKTYHEFEKVNIEIEDNLEEFQYSSEGESVENYEDSGEYDESTESKEDSALDLVLVDSSEVPTIVSTEEIENKIFGIQRPVVDSILFDSTMKSPIVPVTEEEKEADINEESTYRTQKSETKNSLFHSAGKYPIISVIKEEKEAQNNEKNTCNTQKLETVNTLHDSRTKSPNIVEIEGEDGVSCNKKKHLETQRSGIDSILFDLATKAPTIEEFEDNEENDYYRNEHTFRTQKSDMDSTLFYSESQEMLQNNVKTSEKEPANKNGETFKAQISTVDSILLDSNSIRKEINSAENEDGEDYSRGKTSEIQRNAAMNSTSFNSSSTKKEHNIAIINEEQEEANSKEEVFEIQRSEKDSALFNTTIKSPNISTTETGEEENKKNTYGTFLEYLYAHSNSSFFKSLKEE